MKFLIPILLLTLPLHAQEIIQPAKKTATQIKAEKVIIPSINFEDVTVEDAIGFLNNRRTEIRDVDDRPIIPNIVTHGKFPKRIDELRVRNITIHEALKLIALKADARLEYKDNVAIIIGQQ